VLDRITPPGRSQALEAFQGTFLHRDTNGCQVTYVAWFLVKQASSAAARGVLVYSRQIRYHEHEIEAPDGSFFIIDTPQEKRIDIRLALDVMRLALNKQLDVGVIFSQDQDLSELGDEIKEIGRAQNRWIKLACAYPVGPRATTTTRGIDKTDWIHMDQNFYDACLDPHDYRPAKYRHPGKPSP
jgi:hypothetical protein